MCQKTIHHLRRANIAIGPLVYSPWRHRALFSAAPFKNEMRMPEPGSVGRVQDERDIHEHTIRYQRRQGGPMQSHVPRQVHTGRGGILHPEFFVRENVAQGLFRTVA